MGGLPEGFSVHGVPISADQLVGRLRLATRPRHATFRKPQRKGACLGLAWEKRTFRVY